MPQDTRLSDDLEAWAEQERRRLGDSPTVEQLAALRAGDLPPEEAERLRDRLAVDPEAAAIYLGLGEAEVARGSSVDVDGAWEELAGKLSDERLEVEIQGKTQGEVVPFHRRVPYRALFGLAALLILGVGLKLFWPGLDSSTAGPFHAVRVTGETFRDSRIEIPGGVTGVEFQILLPGVEGRVVIELLDAARTVVARQRRVVEVGQDEIRFRVPKTSLEAGRSYQLLVRREGAAAEEEPLIDFRFEPKLEAGG